ncbi:MAG TPA: hypothetical protein PK867_26340 [Pirellulales bacterium]|nr:hypothetical protein [Pirellulales bacterium]
MAAKTPKPAAANPREAYDAETVALWNDAYDHAQRTIDGFTTSDATILTAEVLDALIDLTVLLPRRGLVPHELRAAVGPLTTLAQKLSAYLHLTRRQPNDADFIWSAWEALRMALSAADKAAKNQWPPLESLELLDKQGVSHAQIALIYGFVPKGEETSANRYGHLVTAELKERGSAVDWSKWRDPRVVEQEEREAAQDQDEFHGNPFILQAIAPKLLRMRTADDSDGRPRNQAEAMALTGAEVIDR